MPSDVVVESRFAELFAELLEECIQAHLAVDGQMLKQIYLDCGWDNSRQLANLRSGKHQPTKTSIEKCFKGVPNLTASDVLVALHASSDGEKYKANIIKCLKNIDPNIEGIDETAGQPLVVLERSQTYEYIKNAMELRDGLPRPPGWISGEGIDEFITQRVNTGKFDFPIERIRRVFINRYFGDEIADLRRNDRPVSIFDNSLSMVVFLVIGDRHVVKVWEDSGAYIELNQNPFFLPEGVEDLEVFLVAMAFPTDKNDGIRFGGLDLISNASAPKEPDEACLSLLKASTASGGMNSCIVNYNVGFSEKLLETIEAGQNELSVFLLEFAKSNSVRSKLILQNTEIDNVAKFKALLDSHIKDLESFVKNKFLPLFNIESIQANILSQVHPFWLCESLEDVVNKGRLLGEKGFNPYSISIVDFVENRDIILDVAPQVSRFIAQTYWPNLVEGGWGEGEPVLERRVRIDRFLSDSICLAYKSRFFVGGGFYTNGNDEQSTTVSQKNIQKEVLRGMIVAGSAGTGKSSLVDIAGLLGDEFMGGYHCHCLKLSESTFDDVNQFIHQKSYAYCRRTILFLDGLDEDEAAHADPKRRLADIFIRFQKRFLYVVITSRSEFLLHESLWEGSKQRELLTLGGLGFVRCCYLEHFDSDDCLSYLKLFWKSDKGQKLGLDWKSFITQAQEIAEQIPFVEQRPFVLSHIDLLLNHVDNPKELALYDVYFIIMREWCKREAQKINKHYGEQYTWKEIMEYGYFLADAISRGDYPSREQWEMANYARSDNSGALDILEWVRINNPNVQRKGLYDLRCDSQKAYTTLDYRLIGYATALEALHAECSNEAQAEDEGSEEGFVVSKPLNIFTETDWRVINADKFKKLIRYHSTESFIGVNPGENVTFTHLTVMEWFIAWGRIHEDGALWRLCKNLNPLKQHCTDQVLQFLKSSKSFNGDFSGFIFSRVYFGQNREIKLIKTDKISDSLLINCHFNGVQVDNTPTWENCLFIDCKFSGYSPPFGDGSKVYNGNFLQCQLDYSGDFQDHFIVSRFYECRVGSVVPSESQYGYASEGNVLMYCLADHELINWPPFSNLRHGFPLDYEFVRMHRPYLRAEYENYIKDSVASSLHLPYPKKRENSE